MDAAVDAVAGVFPGGDATGQDRHVGVAQRRRAGGGSGRQAFPIVAPDHAGGAPGDRVADDHFDAPEGDAGGHEDVAAVEGNFLAGIEQRDLGAVVQPGFKDACVDGFYGHIGPRLPEVVGSGPAMTGVERTMGWMNCGSVSQGKRIQVSCATSATWVSAVSLPAGFT